MPSPYPCLQPWIWLEMGLLLWVGCAYHLPVHRTSGHFEGACTTFLLHTLLPLCEPLVHCPFFLRSLPESVRIGCATGRQRLQTPRGWAVTRAAAWRRRLGWKEGRASVAARWQHAGAVRDGRRVIWVDAVLNCAAVIQRIQGAVPRTLCYYRAPFYACACALPSTSGTCFHLCDVSYRWNTNGM